MLVGEDADATGDASSAGTQTLRGMLVGEDADATGDARRRGRRRYGGCVVSEDADATPLQLVGEDADATGDASAAGTPTLRLYATAPSAGTLYPVREELVWLDDESGRRAGAWQASLEFVGSLGILVFASGRALLRGRIERRETVHQMAFIGAASAPIVALTSAFTGAVVTLYSASLLVQAGGGGFVGGAIALAMTRELAPILTGIMVTARCGSAIAAQLGTMKITEQIDALRALAVSPIQYLVIPRVLAALIMFPLLGMIANFSGVLGGWIVANAFGIGLSSFLQSMRLLTEPFDLIGGLIKTLAFALIVTLVSCQQGLGARGGAAGVGHATTRAVVLSMVLIFAANYFLADLLFADR